MSWTTPETYAYKEVLSSAKLNAQVKDNLSFLRSLGTDATSAVVATEDTETSTSYDDIGTDGPTISYSPTASKVVLLLYGCNMSNSAIGNTTYASIAISGATTLAASDANSINLRPSGTNGQEKMVLMKAIIVTLAAGANTIKLRYRVEAGTGTYSNRFLVMLPLS